jgi:hypothetical protein
MKHNEHVRVWIYHQSNKAEDMMKYAALKHEYGGATEKNWRSLYKKGERLAFNCALRIREFNCE